MQQKNLEQTIKLKIETAQDKVSARLYKDFKNSKTAEEREEIYAKEAVLRLVVLDLLNSL